MTFMLQPEGSSLCGQTCVAMVADIPLEQSVSVFGKRGCTTTKDVVNALRKIGFNCGDKLLLSKTNKKPDFCMCVLHYESLNQTHWSVWDGQQYVDPAYGILPDYPEGFRVTSYLPIYGRKN